MRSFGLNGGVPGKRIGWRWLALPPLPWLRSTKGNGSACACCDNKPMTTRIKIAKKLLPNISLLRLIKCWLFECSDFELLGCTITSCIYTAGLKRWVKQKASQLFLMMALKWRREQRECMNFYICMYVCIYVCVYVRVNEYVCPKVDHLRAVSTLLTRNVAGNFQTIFSKEESVGLQEVAVHPHWGSNILVLFSFYYLWKRK